MPEEGYRTHFVRLVSVVCIAGSAGDKSRGHRTELDINRLQISRRAIM